jgi:hypothetical protein
MDKFMYRYLFEETCFDHSFESKKFLDAELQNKARDILAKNLGLKYEDIRLAYYKKSEGATEVEFEATVRVDENFEFRAILTVSSDKTTIVSLSTQLSRLDPVYLRDFNSSEGIVRNIFQEFAKNSFYQDIFADYKRKYEEISKKTNDGLEVLFGF